MTATPTFNGPYAPEGRDTAVPPGLLYFLVANGQIGYGQFATVAPATGLASLNDGTVPDQIPAGVGYGAYVSPTSTAASAAEAAVWQGWGGHVPASTITNDGFTVADTCTPFYIANENTPGKLSNYSGSNRTLGGFVLGLYSDGTPRIMCSPLAWQIARAAVQADARTHAWHSLADAAASTTTSERFVASEKIHGLVTAVQYTGGAVAADNTDYVTITITKYAGDGTTPVVVATYDSRAANQGAASAGVPKAFGLSAVAGALNILETDSFTIQVAKGGAGKSLLGAVRVITKVG